MPSGPGTGSVGSGRGPRGYWPVQPAGLDEVVTAALLLARLALAVAPVELSAAELAKPAELVALPPSADRLAAADCAAAESAPDVPVVAALVRAAELDGAAELVQLGGALLIAGALLLAGWLVPGWLADELVDELAAGCPPAVRAAIRTGRGGRAEIGGRALVTSRITGSVLSASTEAPSR